MRRRLDPPFKREFETQKTLSLGEGRRDDGARRLRDLLAQFVVPGLGSDEPLPPEDAIAREFQCSRNTARVAIQMLAEEHAIHRTVGVGTYARYVPRAWPPARLWDAVSAGSRVTRERRLIGVQVADELPQPMRDRFPGSTDRMGTYEYVVLYDGEPGAVRTYYVPLRPGDDLAETPDDVFRMLEEEFAYTDLHADRTIAALAADRSAAQLLQVPLGAPVLHIATMVYEQGGDLVLAYFIRQRGDLLQVSIEATRWKVDEARRRLPPGSTR